MQIVELLDKAKAGYTDDGALGLYYDATTGEPEADASGDTLSRFVVLELTSTFDPGDTDEGQVDEAQAVIMQAVEQLMGVFHALKQ